LVCSMSGKFSIAVCVLKTSVKFDYPSVYSMFDGKHAVIISN